MILYMIDEKYGYKKSIGYISLIRSIARRERSNNLMILIKWSKQQLRLKEIEEIYFEGM